ncbi:MAG TPA: hypothetical protein VL495_06685 [Edaphobacter sp.]|jgi:hypothetical protein|nr:hypothetical protein [Edaphobacter sp.]
MKSRFVVAITFVASCCCAQTAAAPAEAATSSPGGTIPKVSFQFERVGLPVPKFTIVVHEDGTGTYQAEIAPVSSGGMGQTAAASSVNQPITVSSPTKEMIFKTARSLDHFNIECASKAKHIADTGKKVLSYQGTDGQGSCLYNYSENKGIMQLTDIFYALAFTMDEGRKLAFLHRFDRLGLYSEMDVLQHEVEGKRAIELANIAPALHSIIADEDLMQRVRERAARLLAQVDDGTK